MVVNYVTGPEQHMLSKGAELLKVRSPLVNLLLELEDYPAAVAIMLSRLNTISRTTIPTVIQLDEMLHHLLNSAPVIWGDILPLTEDEIRRYQIAVGGLLRTMPTTRDRLLDRARVVSWCSFKHPHFTERLCSLSSYGEWAKPAVDALIVWLDDQR